MKPINKIFMVVCMLFAALAAKAQTATVTGVVLDADGPLPGASVFVKGTNNAVVTDFDGNFTLSNVDAAKATLTVSYVGYENKEVKLDGRTSGIEIFMEANSTMLDEMVVIGYGTQKRGNLTGALSSIESATIERLPVANVGEAMIGRMPGVQVTTPDGSPDAEVTVRIRGGSSITQSNDPLVLIDGFEGSLNDVPATDIDNIQVLKDAASTAIYGARGANGVVLVTTKRPNEGRHTTSSAQTMSASLPRAQAPAPASPTTSDRPTKPTSTRAMKATTGKTSSSAPIPYLGPWTAPSTAVTRSSNTNSASCTRTSPA